MQKIIYDFGANRGQNIDYYLSKADKVVALEANPALCSLMAKDHQDAIAAGRLAIENFCLTDGEPGEVSFYVHKFSSELSQFDEPIEKEKSNFNKIILRSEKASNLIKKHGKAFFIKIDLEGMDMRVWNEIHQHCEPPTFISMEAKKPWQRELIVNTPGYIGFNLVPGATVAYFYPSFKKQTAGPFGHDLKSQWMDGPTTLKLLSTLSHGWLDIHATTDVSLPLGEPDEKYLLPLEKLKPIYGLKKRLRKMMQQFGPTNFLVNQYRKANKA